MSVNTLGNSTWNCFPTEMFHESGERQTQCQRRKVGRVRRLQQGKRRSEDGDRIRASCLVLQSPVAAVLAIHRLK